MTSPHHRAALAVALVVMASTGGCRDDPSPPPIVWEGEHLRFGTDADQGELCAGTLPYLDGVAGHLGEVFGRPRRPVDYYWLPEGTEPLCPEGALGCSTEQGVVSKVPVHQHELVHGVRFPRTMAMPLEEGLAEAFGDDWDPPYGTSDDIRSVLQEPKQHFPGGGYGRAGHFMSYVLATYGLDAVLELEASTSYDGTSFAALEGAVQDALGPSLETVITEYEADYPRCNLRTYRDKAYDCSRQVIAAPVTLGERLEHTISLACDDPAVIGPRFGHRWTSVSLEIAEAGGYHIVVGPHESSATEVLEIRRCDLSCFDYGDDLLSRTTGYEFNAGFCLEPGRYLFRFAIDEELDGEYELLVTRSEFIPCD